MSSKIIASPPLLPLPLASAIPGRSTKKRGVSPGEALSYARGGVPIQRLMARRDGIEPYSCPGRVQVLGLTGEKAYTEGLSYSASLAYLARVYRA